MTRSSPTKRAGRRRTPGRSSGEVQSLLRGLALIEACADHDGRGAGLNDLARSAGLAPSTAHRLLATLQGEGYVARDGDSSLYTLGHRIAGVAATLQQRTSHLRAVVRPHLEEIAAVTGETANLVVLDGSWSVYIDKVDGSHALRMVMRVGSVFPAHSSASAKAILAFEPNDDRLGYIFAAAHLRKLAKNTIVTAKAFQAALKSVRAKFYAIETDELEDGVSCIAAPLFGNDGRAVAAISVPGPTSRIMVPQPDRLGHLLRRHAEQITAVLRRSHIAAR